MVKHLGLILIASAIIIVVIVSYTYVDSTIINPTGLTFEKILLSKSEINSDETAIITVNVKNYKESFKNIFVKTKSDDVNNQYLTISTASLPLPDIDYPNKNTGDHTITIKPHDISLTKIPFKITVEVYANNIAEPMLTYDFDLTVKK